MLTKNVQAAQRQWAQLVVSNARSILIGAGKEATGRLVQSVSYKLDVQTGDIEFSTVPYGEYVAEGRKKYPGRGVNPEGAFVSAIENWVRVKGIRGRDKRGRFITNKSLSFLIARSINKKGIKPLPFFSLAIRKSGGVKALNKLVAEAVKKDIVEKVRGALKS